MIDATTDILKIIKKPSKGAFIYGSFALYGQIDNVNDIDIFNLCEGSKIHERIIKNYKGTEIHEYRISKDVILEDILKKKFGGMHACNFWGPVVNLVDSKEIKSLIDIARKEKINDSLLFISFFNNNGFTIEEIIESQYIIESIFNPYSINIGRKINIALSENKNNEILQEWKNHIRVILNDNSFRDISVISKGDEFFIKSKKQNNFAKIYTDSYLDRLKFWKTYFETHEHDWNQVFSHASKHCNSLEDIDNYLLNSISEIIKKNKK